MSEAAQLETVIEAAWEGRADLSSSTRGETRQAVEPARRGWPRAEPTASGPRTNG